MTDQERQTARMVSIRFGSVRLVNEEDWLLAGANRHLREPVPLNPKGPPGAAYNSRGRRLR